MYGFVKHIKNAAYTPPSAAKVQYAFLKIGRRGGIELYDCNGNYHNKNERKGEETGRMM
jgi:hypothetical protein